LISGRKAFQRPMSEGVELLNAIQDVYLSNEITVAWARHHESATNKKHARKLYLNASPLYFARALPSGSIWQIKFARGHADIAAV